MMPFDNYKLCQLNTSASAGKHSLICRPGYTTKYALQAVLLSGHEFQVDEVGSTATEVIQPPAQEEPTPIQRKNKKFRNPTLVP